MSQVHQGILWLLLHIAIGAVANVAPMVPGVWVLAVVGMAIVFAIHDRNKHGYLHLAACYLCGFEVLTRMVKSPIPWETGRYAGIPLLLLGILMGRRLKLLVPGLVLLACIVPALILTDTTKDFRKTIVFNWSGAFVLALSVMYFNRRILLERDVHWILRALAGPVVSVMVASIIKTPELSQIDFSLSSKHVATGFGPNQMATVYGLGIVALTLAFLLNRPIFGLPAIDFGVALYIFFRALISLSRGGLFAALIAIVAAVGVILWAYYRGQKIGQTVRIRQLLLLPVLLSVLAVVFLVADQVTGGVLSQRYRGETDGTLSGHREKTYVTMTSGRTEIIRTDFEMWWDHLFLGVGPGNSADMRPNYGFRVVAPHTEYSRLVSEHGIFGFIFTLIIFIYPFKMALDPRVPVIGRAILLAFAMFSLATMAHSATRLFANTMLFGLAWALIIPKDVVVRFALKHPILRKKIVDSLQLGGRQLPEASR